MLRLRFMNVAEGDSILIEDIEQTQTFRMLIDTGRDTVNGPAPRATCAAHLATLGIDRIDQVLITHLHADHVGGLNDVLRSVRVGTILSGYMPLQSGRICHADEKLIRQTKALEPKDEKQVRSMASCLNMWSTAIERARSSGVGTRELFAGWYGVRLTPRLTADFIVPDVGASRIQRDVYNSMLSEIRMPVDRIVRAARLRNPNSLRVRLYYAGRSIELSGDCYGSLWDKQELAPCDILKVPHHGDAKSITKLLATKLKPKHAVICCSSSYIASKDRPSASAIALLRKAGATVWFTDAYKEKNRPARSAATTDFTISEDGTITPPRST